MIKAWYIDSLDPRGGLSFASFRVAEDIDCEKIEEAERTVFLSPPYFAPVVLTSRVTGLSAARGSFQRGVFTDRAEVPFHSIADVAAFVSRLYGATGGGDEPGGGEGPPLPPPEGEPDGPPEPRGEAGDGQRDAAEELHADAKSFNASFHDLTWNGEGWRPAALEAASWFKRMNEGGGRIYAPHPLRNALSLLQRELVWRYPGAAGSRREETLSWLEAAGALTELTVLVGLHFYPLGGIGEKLGELSRPDALTKLLEYWNDDALRKATRKNPAALTDPNFWRLMGLWSYAGLFRDAPFETDPTVSLARLPLPASARKLMAKSACDPGRLTLLSLMSYCTAAPGVLAGSPPEVRDLVLFGACVLGNASNGSVARHLRSPFFVPNPGLHAAHLDAVVRRGLIWLRESLPDRALPTQLEGMIEDGALALTYQ